MLLALMATALTAVPTSLPDFTFTTEESFDPRDIPAYAGDHADIHAHIDEHQKEHLAQLQRWIRQLRSAPRTSASRR